MDGNDGEIYSLYEISNGMSVTALLVASPRFVRNRRLNCSTLDDAGISPMYDCMDVFLCRQHHPGATYFGKLTFATKKTKIEITPADVTIRDLKADSVEDRPVEVRADYPSF